MVRLPKCRALRKSCRSALAQGAGGSEMYDIRTSLTLCIRTSLTVSDTLRLRGRSGVCKGRGAMVRLPKCSALRKSCRSALAQGAGGSETRPYRSTCHSGILCLQRHRFGMGQPNGVWPAAQTTSARPSVTCLRDPTSRGRRTPCANPRPCRGGSQTRPGVLSGGSCPLQSSANTFGPPILYPGKPRVDGPRHSRGRGWPHWVQKRSCGSFSAPHWPQ